MPKQYDTDDIYAHAFAQHLVASLGPCATENPHDVKDRVAAALYYRITSCLPNLRHKLSVLGKQHGQGSLLVHRYAEHVRRAEALHDRQVNQLRDLSNPTPAKVAWFASSPDMLASYEAYEQSSGCPERDGHTRVTVRAYKRLIETGYMLKPLQELDPHFMLDEIVEACLRWYTNSQYNKDSQAGPVGQGMSWQKAQEKGEAIVKKYKGAFPGLRRLAEDVGCSPGTMKKAIDHSIFLKARVAEALQHGQKAAREVSLPDPTLEDAQQTTERDPATLAELIDEQESEMQREGRQHQAAQHRR